MEGCQIRRSFTQELRFVLVLSVLRSGVKAFGWGERRKQNFRNKHPWAWNLAITLWELVPWCLFITEALQMEVGQWDIDHPCQMEEKVDWSFQQIGKSVTKQEKKQAWDCKIITHMFWYVECIYMEIFLKVSQWGWWNRWSLEQQGSTLIDYHIV